MLKALPAKHRTSLCRLERNRRVCPAFRTGGSGLGANPTRSCRTFGFAILATFGVIFELFVVKEELLTGGENKVAPAINAF